MNAASVFLQRQFSKLISLHRSGKNFQTDVLDCSLTTKDYSPKRQFKNSSHDGVKLINLENCYSFRGTTTPSSSQITATGGTCSAVRIINISQRHFRFALNIGASKRNRGVLPPL